MDPSNKQVMVHIAATIKYMCPYLKTLEVMKIVKFNCEDLKYSSSFWRATDRRVTQLHTKNDIAPVAPPVPVINIPVVADALSTIPLSSSATSFSTMTWEDNSHDHLTHRSTRKNKQTLLAPFISEDPLIMDQIYGLKSPPLLSSKSPPSSSLLSLILPPLFSSPTPTAATSIPLVTKETSVDCSLMDDHANHINVDLCLKNQRKKKR